MNTSRGKTSTIVAAVVGVLLVFGAGFQLGRSGQSSSSRISGVANMESALASTTDFSLFWQAWEILDREFVPTNGTTTKKLTDQEKVWGAIAGLTRAYGDPYTVFFNPEQTELFESDISGQFEGVGMEVGIRDDILTVITPLKGTPADRAGVRAGDKILKIDDRITGEMSVDEAVRLIRGKRGTVVRLTIFRENAGELPEISIQRETITIPTIELKPGDSPRLEPGESGTGLRPDGVFVIKLNSFGASSPEQFRLALQQFVKSNSDKLILDLRGNPGGYLEAAVEMASWFLPKGKVVVTEKSSEDVDPIYHTSRGYDIFNENLKMAVLVDKGSASASEILAGALREHGIAKLVGEKTFGKGSVQELVPLDGEASIKVTVARWYTPNGNSISNGGLKPDIEVVPTKEDIEKKRDPQIDRAVKLLLESRTTRQ